MNDELGKSEGSGRDVFLVTIPPFSEKTDETYRNLNRDS
jgi:hypothetical protein